MGTSSDQDVTLDGRRFSVIRAGRRWTKVPEYMSNGQRTARWFMDEASGEVRLAHGWKAPAPSPIGGAAAEFVRGIVAAAQ